MRWPTVWYAAAAGLGAGALLDVLTYWVARAGPAGDGWSFRGNGALVVPFGLGPAVLAGGLTAVVLYVRGARGWRRLGIAAALVGALPAVSSVLMLVAFGNDAQGLSDLMTLPALAWPLIALVLAFVLTRRPRAVTRNTTLELTLAGLAFTIGLVAGFVATEIALPPGSA